MKKFFSIVTYSLLFIIYVSCGFVSDRKTNNVKDSIIEVTNINDSSSLEFNENFLDFLDSFNSSEVFQYSRVVFLLRYLSYELLKEFPDTAFLTQGEYEFITLTEPTSNIVEGKVLLKFSYHSDRLITIKLQIEDTGIMIFHNFIQIKGKWYLNEIVDGST